ncbi:MAG: NAD-dependent epimerase/dehydratase family protein [Chthoniobacterales bacterium]
MKWLVTGAGGFLGSAVGEAIVAQGHEVIGLDRHAEKSASWPGEYVRSDLGSPESTAEILRSAAPDVVAHFAGTASVGESFTAPFADFEGSTALWFRLLEAVRLSGLHPQIALASSAAVYGSPEQLPTPESAPRNPESPYGFHKLLSEHVGEEFAACFGFSIMSLRFFSVFGPRQRRLLVWEIFDQLRRGATVLRLKGTGDERRDFLHVDEAAAAVVSACSAPRAGFQAINIASGTSVSVREMAEMLRECAGSAAQIEFGREILRGNPPHWQADVSLLQNLAPAWSPQPLAKSLANCAAAWNGAEAGGRIAAGTP